MKSSFFDFHLFPDSEREPLRFRLSGKEGSHVLAVVNLPQHREELLAFLGKILTAAKLNMEEDVLLLNLTKGETISFSQLCQLYPFQYVLIFGLPPGQLGIHASLQPYRPAMLAGRQVLYADELPAIFRERQSGGTKMSGALWKALQHLFLKPETKP